VIEELNGLDELPHGWIRTQLSEVAEIILGQSPPSSTYNEDREGLPFYQGKLEFGKLYPTPRKWCMAPKKIAEQGDVLISVRAPVGPTNICQEKSCIGRGLAAIRGLGGIGTFFILYVLRALESEIARKGTGTTFSAIGDDKLKTLEIPLPPLHEQVRIVARLEELFARLDAGVEGLRKVKAQLKRYRQAVLKYAFEGKLTEEWRKTHKDQIEPATKLLERIKQERKQKLGPKYKELPPIETSELPQLPEGWTWARPGEFAQVNPGFPCGKHNKDKKGIPHIRPMNIDVNGKIDLSDVKYVHCLTYDALLKGDVLFNNTNSPELLGKTAYIEENTNWAYSNHMTRLRFNTYLLDSGYVSYYLHNLFLSGFFKISCVHHVNQASINSGFLSERVVIALPSLDEQHKIAEEIKLRQSVAEDIEKAIAESLMQTERLRQGILKMAFEGRLIPQDPGDEPADKLLERIKEERAKSKGEKVINKKKNKSKQLELSAYVE
jgi:type I restriction enzyme S subunit